MALIELVVALGILTTAVIPLGAILVHERNLCRAYYYRAVAMEVVDGEMEVLVAGEWRAAQAGSQPYTVRAEAAKNLPPGRFVLTVQEKRLRLEWTPDNPRSGGKVVREAAVP
jgi:hypothetical protein